MGRTLGLTGSLAAGPGVWW